MQKLIVNYYIFAILGLIAQAVFVVFSSNISIATNLEIKTLQFANQTASDRIRILQDKISSNNSSYNLTSQTEFADYVPITNRTLVSSRSLASLE